MLVLAKRIQSKKTICKILNQTVRENRLNKWGRLEINEYSTMAKILNSLFCTSKPKNSGQLGSNEDAAKVAIDEGLIRKHLEQLNIYK